MHYVFCLEDLLVWKTGMLELLIMWREAQCAEMLMESIKRRRCMFAPSDILTVAGSRFARPHVFGLFSVTLISNPAGDQTPFYPLSTRHRTLSKFEKKKSDNSKRNNTSYFPQSFICQKTILGIHRTTKVFCLSLTLLSLQWHLYFVPRESGGDDDDDDGELTNLKPSNEAKQHLKSQQAQVERSSFFCYNILNNLLINLQYWSNQSHHLWPRVWHMAFYPTFKFGHWDQKQTFPFNCDRLERRRQNLKLNCN